MRRSKTITPRDRVVERWVTVRGAANIIIDATLGKHFRVALSASATLEPPVNPLPGKIVIRVEWLATATLTLHSSLVLVGSFTSPTTSGSVVYLTLYYDEDAKAWEVVNQDGDGVSTGATVTTTRITTTGDGTFAHPSGATWASWDIVGGGGGGGGGRNTANGAANHMGGRGGGGGARLQKVFRLADLPDPIPYHVGAGGTGGAGAAGSSGATGTDGTAGEDTTIGTTTVYGRAGGGGGGAGGSGAGCAGGGGGGTAGTGGSTLVGGATTAWTLGGGPQMFDTNTTIRRGNVGGEGGFGGLGTAGGDSQTGLGAEWGGGGGGGSGADTTTTGRGGTSVHGGGGGGAGGTSHTGTIQDGLAGGASGTFIYWNSGSASGGGAGGTSGAAPTAGTAGTAGTSALSGFGGGGGGCTDTNDTAGKDGGAGGVCGGGGGGGGGGKGTGAGGNGGAGGRGEIRISCW